MSSDPRGAAVVPRPDNQGGVAPHHPPAGTSGRVSGLLLNDNGVCYFLLFLNSI